MTLKNAFIVYLDLSINYRIDYVKYVTQDGFILRMMT